MAGGPGPTVLATSLALACLCPSAPSAAQAHPDGPRFETTDGVPAVDTFVPGRWGVVGVKVANPADRPADVLAALYFEGQPDLQFARRLWVPPRARLTSWHPVLPPRDPVRSLQHLDVRSLLIDPTGERRGTAIEDGLLPSSKEQAPVSGLIADAEDSQAELAILVARASFGMPARIVRLQGESLPPTVESLQALDQLVVASDRAARDAAGLHAIRRWLHRGGRLWVQLDRVSPATAALLLGQEFPAAVLDRVELSHWRFVKGPAAEGPDDETPPPGAAGGDNPVQSDAEVDTFEKPVEMVRIVAPGVKPLYSVRGWPAAFRQRCGRGVVLFTTLAPRGWVELRSKSAAAPGPLGPHAAYTPTAPLGELMGYFLRVPRGHVLAPVDFETFLAEQVGYRIVGRATVIAVLAVFCLGVAAAGWWLGCSGRLAHLGWVGPAAAVAAAVLLMALGDLSRRSVPGTVAEAQLIQAVPDATDAPVAGLLAVYNSEESAAPLGADNGGTFLPDLAGAGTTHRMVWTDLDRWHWENLPLTAGLHFARFESSARLDRPLAARVSFGPEGVRGRIDLGPLRNRGDALLALPMRGNLAVRFAGADGGFASSPGDQLARGQFLAAATLTDEQRRRQAVYRQLFEAGAPASFPQQPTLLTWTSPLDLGFTFPQGVKRTGSALVMVPFVIERPTPGTTVVLPGPFLSYRSVPLEGRRASLYNAGLNQWVSSMKGPGRTLLRFQVPRELLPLRVERAALTIRLNAQARPFEVFAGPDAAFAVLATRHSPVGSHRIPIDAQALQPDADGGAYLGVSVGAAQKLPGETIASSQWKIEELQLELVGRILESGTARAGG